MKIKNFFHNLFVLLRLANSNKSVKDAIREMFHDDMINLREHITSEIRNEYTSALSQTRESILSDIGEKCMAASAPPLLSLVDDSGRPTGSADMINKIDFLINNSKLFASYLSEIYNDRLQKKPILSKPQAILLNSKLATQSDFESDWYRYWMQKLKIPFNFHRKNWEWAYIIQVLFNNGMLIPEKACIGFGCGVELLPSFFASKGCTVLATDQPPSNEDSRRWEVSQYLKSIDLLFKPELLDRKTFEEKVSVRYIDMNELPNDLYGSFDFCWSSCVVEHLGSIEKGLNFLKNVTKVLKPGGISVHTIEFNYLDTVATLDNCPNVIFKRSDIERLASELKAVNAKMFPLDFSKGTGLLDIYIDLPPFPLQKLSGININATEIYPKGVPHINLWLDGFPSTSFGVIIKRLK
jgi:2-polyprenyl-3-methyl-5-hydroxy-6-metoxy-1,4-benzoquinol methylase